MTFVLLKEGSLDLPRFFDTMDPEDLTEFIKINFMKSRISNSAKTDPVLPCENYYSRIQPGTGARAPPPPYIRIIL